MISVMNPYSIDQTSPAADAGNNYTVTSLSVDQLIIGGTNVLPNGTILYGTVTHFAGYGAVALSISMPSVYASLLDADYACSVGGTGSLTGNPNTGQVYYSQVWYRTKQAAAGGQYLVIFTDPASGPLPSAMLTDPQAQLLPGSGIIGHGFDGFGRLDGSALTNKLRLFSFNTPGANTYSLNNVSYNVPQNADVMPVNARTGGSQTFTQKTDVSQFFSAQIGVSGKYFAFSGEFNALFQRITNQVSENEFGLYYFTTDGYVLEITDPTPANLDPSVLQDPDYLDLPKTFNADDSANVAAFFRFFYKYGTHFVNSVSMGGRLFYSISIDKSYGFSSTEFEADLSVEYKAVWGAKAQAQVEWNQLSQSWVANRTVTISALGGDDSILNVLSPPVSGENYNDALTNWIGTIAANPGPMNFSLMGVDQLFSGTQATAVQQAAQLYNTQMLLLSTTPSTNPDDPSGSGGQIVLNGTLIQPPTFSTTGVQVAVFDRTSLALIFTGCYPDNNPFAIGSQYDYTNVYDDLSEFSNDANVLIAMNFWGQFSITGYPTGDMLAFMQGCGAGSGLEEWGQYNTSAAYCVCTYALVGVPGMSPGAGVETFIKTTDVTGEPFPGLQMQVFLQPGFVAGQLQYTPV